jgi:hypothetical protein
MTIRILSFTLAAAWIAAARPAHAYDPSDPKGPSPDDPAWGHIGERAAEPAAPAPEPRSSAVAEIRLGRSVRGLDCQCAAVQALPDAHGEDEAAQPDRAGGGAAETYR